MRVTVIGGTGLVGAKLVRRLRALGHDALAAARAALGTYFGARLGRRDLLPAQDAVISSTRFHEWRAADLEPGSVA